jgi:uracil-DNA glycosylase family 4
MILVPPDGPSPCDYAVVGEAPASEEVRLGRGFVGPSGSLLWPLMRRLALLNREQCYVTNLCKHPLDNDVSGDAKLTAEEFEACRRELWAELDRVRPARVLAVGALAAKALLGERYTEMSVCNGIGFAVPDHGPDYHGYDSIVLPTWHPAAALRPGGEDRLAYTGAAIAAFNPERAVKMCPRVPPGVPPPDRFPFRAGLWCDDHMHHKLGIDTEGTPDDPVCMTIATTHRRGYVGAADVGNFFALLPTDIWLIFHNALWDWPVLYAMGAPRDLHTRWQWCDTMELAYLKQTEPRGLKDLAYRHLGLRMRTWEEVVQPYYREMLRATAEGRVAAGTTRVTHSPKTGRALKKPREILTDDAKRLRRVLSNPKLLAERMPGLPPPTLRLVPEAERVEYATLDAWATVMLEEHLR